MPPRSWETHYTSGRSELLYPDENLVRLLKKNLPPDAGSAAIVAVDLGCGSGRHLKLLGDLGLGRAIGMDSSMNALRLSRKNFDVPLVRCDNRHIPLKPDSVHVVIAWGSLHYDRKSELGTMLSEIGRVLRTGGQLFATLRSGRDTFLKKGRHLGDDTWVTDLDDINGAVVSFYGEEEIKKEFSLFSQCRYGLMERTLIGDTSSLISHWVIHAVK